MANLLFVLQTDPLPLLACMVLSLSLYYTLKAWCFETRRQVVRSQDWRTR